MATPKLLIVDDDYVITSLLRSILVPAGYEVRIANDGGRAMDLLARETDFSAVLLDRRMPDLDGLDLLRHMKATSALKDIPVVLETAMDGDAEVREGLRAGALYYLVKPLDPPLVLQVIAAATAEYAAKRKMWQEMEGVRAAMGLVERGVFRFRTLEQCANLAALLAKACPDPRRAGIGLQELMINAVEHGNLGISYARKTALIQAGAWAEEVRRLQELPENQERWAKVAVARSAGRIKFRIEDLGQGFAWADFMEIKAERMFDSHGRGILLARWEAFDHIEYLGCGNTVVAELQQDVNR